MKDSIIKINKLLHKKSFLLRILITTLLASLIPLSLMTAQLVSNESKSMEKSVTLRLGNSSYNIGIQFDKMVSTMDSIAVKLMLSNCLYNSIIDKSINNEIIALDTLSYYSEALPFISKIIVYYPDKSAAYTSSGKMYKNGLANNLLGISVAEFDEFISHCKTSGFAPYSLANHILYIVPFKNYANSSIVQYAIFLFNSNMFDNTMESFLNGFYSLLSISYDNLEVYKGSNLSLSSVENSAEYILSSCISTKLYKINVAAKKSILYDDYNQVLTHTRKLVGVNILLCLVLITMVVLYNYRPLLSIFHLLQSKDSNSVESVPEIESISRSIHSLINQNTTLEKQLEQKNILLTDRMLERLLSGRRPTEECIDTFMPDCGRFCIACAQLDELTNVSEIIEINAFSTDIYTLEIYDDNRFVIVLGFHDGDNPSDQDLSLIARKIITNESTILGYSQICTGIDSLYNAYMEAEYALTSNNNSNDRYSRLVKSDSYFLSFSDSKELKELTNAIKSGSEYIVNFAKETLNDIIIHSVNNSMIIYNCFQLVDLYRRATSEAKIEIDMNELACVLASNNESLIRTRILLFVESLQEKAQVSNVQASSISFTDIVSFIEEHYTDPMFGMIDIAEFLGISIYAASRLLKKTTNANFRKYINDKRIEFAKRLLIDTNKSVADIAQISGFSSAAYFNKVFKESIGFSPNSYRNNILNKNQE